MVGRKWFRDDTLDNPQRSAKIVAFASQDTTADAAIVNNTLSHILKDEDLTVKWASIPSPPGTVTWGTQHQNRFLFWKAGDTITLNRAYIPAGNGSLAGNADAKVMSEGVLAHEINHDLNNDKPSETYRSFMGEYRAWYVGYQAEHGHPPSHQECYDRAVYLVSSTNLTEPYGLLGRAFNNAGSPESKQIVEFVAKIRGDNPATATIRSVPAPATLSTIAPGQPPVKAGPDDPFNVDNH